jgi:ribosome biogenesis GTPase / thiamine phosphate phosphatase
MNLKYLGAGERIFGAFSPYAAQGLSLARVVTSQRDLYRLHAASGELEAEPSGSLWYRTERAGMPVVGDWVAAREVAAGQAIVEAVLPRATLFARRAAGAREEPQPIAANIDTVFLVCGLDGDFNLRRLERYLTLAAESGAAPVVVLNKADLAGPADARFAGASAVAGRAPVIRCSAHTEEGIEALTAFLGSGRTVALLGSSGVGKSSIVNRLLGEERFATAEVRESDSRGRHTTTHRELVALPQGGALIDTPGMRELQLWATEESVHSTFEEISTLAQSCRYADCSHANEPGCAVAAALAAGTLDAGRWTGFRKLLGEAQRHERMADPLAAQQHKQKWKRIAKDIKRYYKTK